LHMIVNDGSAAEKQKLQPAAILLELLSNAATPDAEVYPQRVFAAGNPQWKHSGNALDHGGAPQVEGAIPALQSASERQKHFFTKAPSEIDQSNELKDVFKNTVSNSALAAKE